MKMTIPTIPDEDTPLLGNQHRSAIGKVTESDSEVSTLTGPSNQSASNISGKSNPGQGSDRSEVAKKTPLPWAQFSIILFLQLAEPLTSQVISPVSFFYSPTESTHRSCALNNPSSFS
jgi:hypothetical protein